MSNAQNRPIAILGISAYYHDSAAALVVDGQIIAAAQEERFTRKKHDPDFPAEAIRYCLQEAQLQLSDISHVVFYDKPLIKFERLIDGKIICGSFERMQLGGSIKTQSLRGLELMVKQLSYFLAM